MHRRMVVTLAILAVVASGVTGCKKEGEQKTEAPQTTAPAAPAPAEPAPPAAGVTGEELFKKHCAACHPNGGNTITPSKSLSAKEMAKRSKITTPEEIVKVMRNPGPGMNKFDEAKISNDDAKKIGEYILATFP